MVFPSVTALGSNPAPVLTCQLCGFETVTRLLLRPASVRRGRFLCCEGRRGPPGRYRASTQGLQLTVAPFLHGWRAGASASSLNVRPPDHPASPLLLFSDTSGDILGQFTCSSSESESRMSAALPTVLHHTLGTQTGANAMARRSPNDLERQLRRLLHFELH